MFNPLDLRGPEFLLFYIAAAIVLNFVLYFWVRFSEPVGVPDARMHTLPRDPYMLAYMELAIRSYAHKRNRVAGREKEIT